MDQPDDVREDDGQIASESARRGPPLVSLIAIGLSLSALLVSVFEVSAVRDEVRFQVWPYVSTSSSYSVGGYAIRVTNKGVGPAKVRRVDFIWDGERVEAPSQSDVLTELVRRAVGDEEAFDYSVYRMSDPEGGVLSADESTSLFSVPWNDTTRKLADEWGKRLSVTVCYCSVYDECWLAELDAGEPDEVQSCPAPAS